MVQAIVRKGSPGGRSETVGAGLVKRVGFKPEAKDRELLMSRVVNQKRKK